MTRRQDRRRIKTKKSKIGNRRKRDQHDAMMAAH